MRRRKRSIKHGDAICRPLEIFTELGMTRLFTWTKNKRPNGREKKEQRNRKWMRWEEINGLVFWHGNTKSRQWAKTVEIFELSCYMCDDKNYRAGLSRNHEPFTITHTNNLELLHMLLCSYCAATTWQFVFLLSIVDVVRLLMADLSCARRFFFSFSAVVQLLSVSKLIAY